MASPRSSPSARDVFESALDLGSDSAPNEFIHSACAGDPALLARVQALWRAYENSASILQETPSSSPGQPAVAALEQAGDWIGRYRLSERIGEGGCGVVYLAEQAEPVRRRVALKIIKPGMDTQAVISRFEAERQALALMDHPSIARVFDAGATETGRPYFVMEWVDGSRLTQYCEEHRLSLASCLDLFCRICLAIQHAHQKGVIHRDIKPSNILVTTVDGSPVPKVIDFGIAKATEAPLTDNPVQTLQQVLMGTPAYMSPEQADFGGANLDTRSDIYSLGVLLYEILTGETPFDGEAELRAGLDVLRRTIREVEPLRPSVRLARAQTRTTTAAVARPAPLRPAVDGQAPAGSDLCAGRPGRAGLPAADDVCGDLDWIVMKCLEKDRARRYESAGDLAQDIRRHLENEPVLARPPSRRYRLQKLVQRNQGAVAALLAFVLLLVASVAISSWLALRAWRAEQTERELRRQAEANERQAREAREHARHEAYSADLRSAGSALAGGDPGRASRLLLQHRPRAGDPDLRGLEWRYLWERTRGDELRSFPNPYSVHCVRFAPNGKRFATANFHAQVEIVDADSGRVELTLPGVTETDTRDSVIFSPDGTLLAFGTDGRVLVRETRRWQVVQELSGGCESLAFSGDGSVFGQTDVSATQFYRVSDWQRLGRVESAGRGQGRLAITSKGDQAAIIRRNTSTVELWDVANSRRLAEFHGSVLPLSLALSPDDRWLAVGDSPGDIRIWDLSARRLVVTQKAHVQWVNTMAFSPDGHLLASGGGDRLVQVWDATRLETNTLAAASTLRGHSHEVWSLSFSGDGTSLLSSGREGTTKLWRPGPRIPDRTQVRPPKDTLWLGFLPNSRLAAVASTATPDLHLWDNLDAKVVRTIHSPRRGAVVLTGTRVTHGTTNGTVEVWDLEDGRHLLSLRLTEGPLLALQASADQRHFVGWDEARAGAALWNLDTRERVTDFPEFALAEISPSWSMSQRAAFSPDGRWLAYAGSNYTVKIWDVAAQREAHTLRGHSWHLQCMRFSPDSRRLATGSWDAQVRLWDPVSGKEVAPFISRLGTGIGSIAFPADGRSLAVRTGDDVLHFFSMTSGVESLAVPDVTAWFFNILSADGNALGWEMGNYSGRFRVFYLPSLAEIDAIEGARER